jgi:hypothetical protein
MNSSAGLLCENDMPDSKSSRFLHPKRLTRGTRVLGASAEEWDRALKGNITETLKEVHRRTLVVAERRAAGQPIDTATMITDVASTFRRKILAR